jgi:hypothetical protein
MTAINIHPSYKSATGFPLQMIYVNIHPSYKSATGFCLQII